MPTFAKEIENATVPVGREATLSCVIYNLGNFKVKYTYPLHTSVAVFSSAFIRNALIDDRRANSNSIVDSQRRVHIQVGPAQRQKPFDVSVNFLVVWPPGANFGRKSLKQK